MEVCTASESCTDGSMNCWEHDWTVFFELVVFIRVHCKEATQSFAVAVVFFFLVLYQVASTDQSEHSQQQYVSHCCQSFNLWLQCYIFFFPLVQWPTALLVKPNWEFVWKLHLTHFSIVYFTNKIPEHASWVGLFFPYLVEFQYLMHRSGRPAGGCSHCDSHSGRSPRRWCMCAGTADMRQHFPAAPPCWQPHLWHPWKKPP